MKDETTMDREALEFAIDVLGIEPSDQVDDAWLRKTSAYAAKRLNLTMRNVGNALMDAVRESWVGRKLNL